MQSTEFTWLLLTLLLIFTDFSAVMALSVFQTLSSSVDGRAINDKFVVAFNQQIIQAGKDKENSEMFNIDVHHFFVETMPK